MGGIARALVLVVLAARLVAAATFVDIASDPGDPIGNGEHVRLGSADGAFTWFAYVFYDGAPRVGGLSVGIALGSGSDQHTWNVRMSAPNTSYLSAGDVYEFSVDPQTGTPPNNVGPGAYANRDNAYLSTGTCTRLHGRFAVEELSLWPDFGLRSLVADLEARCDEREAGIRVALRYHSGDPGCDGQPDGTSCSDADGCTGDDRCQSAHCVSGAPPTCDDGDVTTDEVCTLHEEGCRHVPAASVWLVHGRATITAYGPGGSASRRAQIAGLFVVRADGTYSIPSSEPPCTSVPEPYDETGSWRETHRHQLMLRLESRRELADVIRVCTGLQRARVTGARQWVRVSHRSKPPCPWATDTGGTPSMCGASQTRFAVVYRGVPVTLVYRTRFAGARVDEGAYLPPAR
jgi:hypothetical protein